MKKKTKAKKKWISHFALSKKYCFCPRDRDLTIKIFTADLDQEIRQARKKDYIEIDCRWRNIGDAFNPKSEDFDPEIKAEYYYNIFKKNLK